MVLRDILPKTITTPRLRLDAPHLGDLDTLVALANNDNVVRWTSRMPFPYGRADGEQFLTQVAVSPQQRPYAIRDAEGGLMGVVSLMFHSETPELGYWLGEPFWRRGIASEAVVGLLGAVPAAGWRGDIAARVLSDNAGSIRLLENAGFVLAEETTSIVERHFGKPLRIYRWSAQ